LSWFSVPRLARSWARRGVAVGSAAALLVTIAPIGVLAADTQAPTVAVTWPTGSAVLSGTVTLTASASDNVGVTQAKWFVDSREVGWDGAAPWADTWNASSLSVGWHSIVARAADAANNWATSPTVWFQVGSVTSPAPTGWTLVQSEDFNGSTVDTSKWSVYGPWIPGHNGNGIRDGSAISVADGVLTITARMVNGTLVSGGMSNRLNQTYGRFEFRVRTDPDPSVATNGVILTWPQSQNWPIDGENDIYETTDDADRIPIKSFVHYGADNKQYWFHHTGVDGTQWHTMAMEWEHDAIRIYRDGILVWTVTDQNAIPDVAHHLSIQLDAFKKSMSGTVRLQVDWVKIYRRT
jgi:beta-glucanase (GH16 family)